MRQSFTLSDKASSPGVALLVDHTLALENPFTKVALQHYVSFVTQGVDERELSGWDCGKWGEFHRDGDRGDRYRDHDSLGCQFVAVPNSTLTALSLAME